MVHASNYCRRFVGPVLLRPFRLDNDAEQNRIAIVPHTAAAGRARNLRSDLGPVGSYDTLLIRSLTDSELDTLAACIGLFCYGGQSIRPRWPDGDITHAIVIGGEFLKRSSMQAWRGGTRAGGRADGRIAARPLNINRETQEQQPRPARHARAPLRYRQFLQFYRTIIVTRDDERRSTIIGLL
ncbi:hypothetical protein EVAR_88824_1 [Eumeta japonica]|uniref:Uncharacterized protein n=1 Tax=Eumeta variegata TaxID=151549 RepID=A0A4C1Y572_EUMVA|nr:hypothetical protein EVAR_88824_1 [Eumeta japonica]